MIEFKKLLEYRDLFWQLTFREIKARYKQSVLGYAWAILVPLLNLLVLSIVFSYVFKVPTGSVSYPIFLFTALVPWMFLVNSVTSGVGSITSNATLITKVNFPREILPVCAISSKLIDLLLTVLVLIVFLVVYNISFSLSLIVIPFIFLIQLLLILGISFILSAINVFYRDIENILGVFLTIWMYMTPILYSSTLIPDNLRNLFYLNPMLGIINSYRDTILFGVFPQISDLLYPGVFSFAVFVVGIAYFRKRAKFFADVI